jgi:DNA-binding beta-propeller fold protein YncE
VRAGFRWGAALVALAAVLAQPAAAEFVNFESGQTRPLALSLDGQWLFALNTPDARLAIFDVTDTGLSLVAEVPVGLEPVAVAARPDSSEVWVVNHLSDSVSIVHFNDDEPALSRVVGTLHVSDEPRDVVFASGRAFVTGARRGQHLPDEVPADLTVPGLERALVWVFDADDPFADTTFDADTDPSPLGGEPLTILELFGDAPRALAASPDGTRVYAAIFHSGSRTTTVHPWAVVLGGGLPQPPADSPYFDPAYDPTDATPDLFPTTGLIVKWDEADTRFEDELGRDWSSAVRLTLPDEDVFAIDATQNPPALLAAETSSGVGTTIFNMAVRPGTGEIYVTNTAARNHVRFEPAVRGHLAESRISIVSGGAVESVHLNPHIAYGVTTGPAAEIDQSLAPPTDLVFSSDGATLYVAGFGSGNVGVFSGAGLANGNASRELIEVGGGPSGLALDEAHDRLYVLKRFEQRVAVIDRASVPGAREIIADVGLGFDPSPAAVLRGRRFLYDTRLSGHGDGSCATCHVFGDLDGIGWDLGDPYGTVVADPNPFLNGTSPPAFHPMKGPMTTQSLRGLAEHGPMHWRGDRTGGLVSGGDPLDEQTAFEQFNPAFVGLLGAAQQLPAASMTAFAQFALTIRYPPNPTRPLDDSVTPDAAAGADLFSLGACLLCHHGETGNANAQSVDFTSESGPFPASFAILGLKVPHFRNLYTKVGMFAQSPAGFEDVGANFPASPFLGDQIRGFGFFHDGNKGDPALAAATLDHTPEQHDDLAEFLLSRDTGMAPAVGEQLVAHAGNLNDPATLARRDLLAARAGAGDCDLVVKGVAGGIPRSGLYVFGVVVSDRAAEPAEPLATFWQFAAASGFEQAWTCVPPGSGARMGLDRDEDGARDADERDAGTNPGDPLDVPGGPVLTVVEGAKLDLKEKVVAFGVERQLTFKPRGSTAIVPPAPGSAGDPTVSGATLRLYNASGSGEQWTLALPASGWQRTGSGYKHCPKGTTVRCVTVRPHSFTVKLEGTDIGYTLDERRQGRLAVRLTLGTGVQWCAESGARIDVPGRFRGARATGVVGPCPVAPAG